MADRNNLTTLAKRLRPLLGNFAQGLVKSVIGEGPGIDLTVSGDITTVGLGGDSFLLYDDETANPVAEYATLTLALAAAIAGQVVITPSGTYTEDVTVPPGVGVRSTGNNTIVIGTIILGGNNSYLKGITNAITVNSVGTIIGVIGPPAGLAIINDCTIMITNNGAGNAYAVQVENGNIEVWQSDCNGIVTGAGIGAGFYRAGTGEVKQHGGKTFGTNHNAYDAAGGGFTRGAILGAGVIPGDLPTGPAGVEVPGLTIGDWYCIESSGGPFYYTIPAGLPTSGYVMTANTINTIDMSVAMGFRIFSDNSWHDQPPIWCIHAERVGSNWYRFFFQATTTSIWLWMWEGFWADNPPGSMDYTLYSATVGFMNWYKVSAVDGGELGYPLFGDKAAWDALVHSTWHANDINIGIHWTEDEIKNIIPNFVPDHDHSGDVGDGGTFDAANLTSGASGIGDVLTSDGIGGADWEPPVGGAVDASGVTYTPADDTDWDGDIDPGNADDAFDQLASRVEDLEAIGPGSGWVFPADGRLTLESGVPVSITDQTAKTTLYYTPYIGSQIALYDGGAWNLIVFAEISIAIPATTSQMYDVFCYDNAGTATLELLAWTNDTTRATALVRQNGILCKTGALTRRYLGSMRTTTVNGKTEDSIVARFVWNYYNRVWRYTKVTETTAHAYNGAWRKWNNSDVNNLWKYIIGIIEDANFIQLGGSMYSPAATIAVTDVYINAASCGPGNDSGYLGVNGVTAQIYLGRPYHIVPSLGYSYGQVYEIGNNAGSTFKAMEVKQSILG